MIWGLKEKSESVKRMSTHLSDKFRQEISWNGYPSDILKSGLQKYIRRGILNKALYCSAELDLFKHATNRGETIRTNFLHRLMIIYLEDVENTTIFSEINDLFELLFLEREKKENRNFQNEEQWISKIVSLLSHSQKARICSHIRSIFYKKYFIHLQSYYPSLQPLYQEILSNETQQTLSLEFYCNQFKKYYQERNILAVYYAFQIDSSTEKLSKKSLGSLKPVWYIFEKLKNPFNHKLLNKYINWYKNHLGTMKEGFLCWLFPLLIELKIIKEGVTVSEDEKYDSTWDKNRRFEKIEIDDYVLDRHTRKGQLKGLVEFAINGAKVENEANFIQSTWKQFYEDSKRFDENQNILGEEALHLSSKNEPTIPNNISTIIKTDTNIESNKIKEIKMKRPKIMKQEEIIYPLETQEYQFIVRTQITTSSSKMDVYFAKNTENKLVVVKGPYLSREPINILERNTNWKKINNLPYIPFEVKQLLPNRWSEGIPLGARNVVIDRTKPAWFIIFDSVINDSDLQTKKHSSRLWTETEVVNWDKIPLHFNYKKSLSEQEYIDYIEALLFRYVCGISDLADRNFLRIDGRIISIDEDISHKEVNIYNELRKNKAEHMYHWIEKNYNKLKINKWKDVPDKYKKDLTLEGCLELFRNK